MAMPGRYSPSSALFKIARSGLNSDIWALIDKPGPDILRLPGSAITIASALRAMSPILHDGRLSCWPDAR